MHDLRYALRRLGSSPGFTAVAILSLALGIGANSAMFSIVNAFLLRDLNVRRPDRLVEIYTSDDNGFPYSVSSVADFRSVRADTRGVFDDVIGSEMFIAQIQEGESSHLVTGELVSGTYFDVLGVAPVVGRSFTAAEDATAGTHAVVILGYGYWQQHFAGDRDAIGKTVLINRRAYTIVGVAPQDYTGAFRGLKTQMFVPMMMSNAVMPGSLDRLNNRGSRSLFMKGRLADGITVERARAAVETVSKRLEQEFPDTNRKRLMNVLPTESVSIHPMVDKALVPVAALLLSVVGLVLLIACANLASFLLARAADRRKEIAIRLALGAGRFRLIRQLLVESTTLAIAGGAGGVLLAWLMIRALISFQPPLPIPLDLSIDLDTRVLSFTALISILAGIAFGLAPALQSTRPQLSATLRDEAGNITGGRRRITLRNALVIGQVAIAMVLLIGSGLFVRSLQKAQRINPGFYSGPAAILWPNMEMSGYEEERGRQLQSRLRERLLQLPGVTHVTMADRLPLGSGVQTRAMNIDGVTPPADREFLDIDYVHADHDYFSAFDVPIVQGRGFNSTDTRASAAVVVISEAMAKTYWPNRDPIGQSIYLGERGRNPTPFRVIGIARDTKVRTLGEAPRPYVYFSLDQQYVPTFQVMVRGTRAPAQLLAEARRAALDLDPQLVLFETKTMEQHLALMLFPPRMAALLLSVFGGLALSLAAIGLYGLVSYTVSRRTREIGIRMALGASARDVVKLMAGNGLRLVLTGAAIGMVLAGGVSWLLSRFLYGVTALDIATFLAIPAILTVVGSLACYIPALRASRYSPTAALASE
jgi:macrolide transport system ATP-binding/permease protein